jgi:salicylate hydroxylase
MATWSDRKKCREEIGWRSHRIWDYDVGKMVADAVGTYEGRIRSLTTSNQFLDIY